MFFCFMAWVLDVLVEYQSSCLSSSDKVIIPSGSKPSTLIFASMKRASTTAIIIYYIYGYNKRVGFIIAIEPSHSIMDEEW